MTGLRVLAVVLSTLGVGGAAPLTIIFTGTGSGTLGTTQFTNQTFTITFTSDTRLLSPYSVNAMTTPSGTPATVTVAGVTATLQDNQSVFVNPSEFNVGIWHNSGADWLTVANNAFGSYNLKTKIEPPTSGTVSYLNADAMNTSAGALNWSATSTTNDTVTVEVHVGPNVIWQYNPTRQATWWYFNGAGGSTLASWSWLVPQSTQGWHIAAMIDYNNDGYSDLIWENDTTRQVTVWYMGGPAGTALQSWEWLSQSGEPGWSVVGAGDFNHDGIPDLLWENDSTGQVTIWYMGGPGVGLKSWTWLSQSGEPGWTIKAVGDYNGDGTPDVVWQNNSTRQATVWYLGNNGTALLNWEWMSSSSVPGWHIIGMGDFNGDGILDLAWENDSTGQSTVWYMGGPGLGLQSWAWLSQGGESNWSALVAQ